MKIGGVYVQLFGTLKLFLQPHSLGFMRYRVIEGGLEPSTIARGLVKNGKFLPNRGVLSLIKTLIPVSIFHKQPQVTGVL